MKVALVHDWLNQYGGAERVLEVLHDLFPQAPIYTSIYEPAAMPASYRAWDIRTSWLQRIPLVRRAHQPFLPCYPLAFEQFDLSEYDVVLSNSSGFCHGVLTRPETAHLNYCLTPPRYLWDTAHYVQREGLGRVARAALAPALTGLRVWDVLASTRVDAFAGISKAVVARIAKYYRRDAELIYPPVETRRLDMAAEPGAFFLIVSRLVPYKRVDLAVRACSHLGVPLVVVGDGRDRPALERLAGPTIQFRGRAGGDEVRHLLATCRAFLFPGEEDFGIAPIEAMASGRPVIAFKAGGALETVLPGETGEFFAEPTVESLAESLSSFRADRYDPRAIRRWAENFDTAIFRDRILDWVARTTASGSAHELVEVG
ncbi:MAG: glycosyltransferase [Chloroflexi bacterium]|nr:glycosyltransferase [Chloroflexota bacterium]